jgi:glycosyltransferase involved in cell wall biosynthesis
MKNGSPFKKVWLNIFVRPFANEVLWHATSLQERKEILSHFPNAKITTIPLPIDLSPYKENKTAKNFYNRFYSHHLPNPLIIISMGRLQKKKGFDILIRSFNNTLSKFPQLLLFIAGEDEGEKAPLEKLIQELNLKEKVFFTGVLQGEDKIAFLQNADLFVLPSHNENFGLVYLEALAAGTPIVASKETPWQEVEDYGCGKWVNNTVEETSEAIVEMLSRKDPEVREKARKLAEKYSMDNVRKILASTLDDLTKNV